jgi:aryl-alcohol dehydrogenase-like predicted oxidoreductase
VQEMAREKGVTASQLALAWVLAHPDTVAIPGTTNAGHLEENVQALSVRLTPEDMERIDEVAPRGAASGDRYHPAGMQAVNR